MIELCLCLVLRSGTSEVLLGEKLRGFGKGRLIGPGGHIEQGETPRSALVREVEEEVGLIVGEADLEPVAELAFRFPANPHLDARVWVFRAETWQGTPRESDELVPTWHSATDPPLDGMWDDNRYWLARALAGEYTRADFTYADDGVTVANVEFLDG